MLFSLEVVCFTDSDLLFLYKAAVKSITAGVKSLILSENFFVTMAGNRRFIRSGDQVPVGTVLTASALQRSCSPVLLRLISLPVTLYRH